MSFLPSVPKTEMPALLSLASVCLATLKDIPLFATVYPNKVFDYMAAGKPTILAIDGVIKDVIEKSEGGIVVKPGDSIAIKNAILTYYQQQQLIKKHGKSAQKYVKENFDRKDIVNNLDHFIKSL